MVLDTLSRIGFNPPEGLPNFIEKALNDCIPRPTGKILGYYRHLDIEGRQHYVGYCAAVRARIDKLHLIYRTTDMKSLANASNLRARQRWRSLPAGY